MLPDRQAGFFHKMPACLLVRGRWERSSRRAVISGGGLALVAQWIEQRTSNPKVAGSNPAGRTYSELLIRSSSTAAANC